MFLTQKLQIFLFVLQAAYVSRGIHGQQQMQMSYVTDGEEEMAAVDIRIPPTGMVDEVASGSNALDWNYTKNGTDWNTTYKYCGAKSFSQQSPATVNISYVKNYDWQQDSFSFIPYFYSTKIASVATDQMVFTINLAKEATGKFFGIQAIEPQHKLYHYVHWETSSIQFHYPAEHPWAQMLKNGTNNTVTAALEMQIYGDDNIGTAVSCKNSKKGVMSLFFFLSDKGTDETDKFFEFQTKDPKELVDSDLDLSVLVNSSTSLYWPIYGYVGGMTQPPCTSKVCWYLLQRSFPITQKQLDYFKLPGVDNNARGADQGKNYKDFANKSIFGKNDEILDPDA